MFSDVAVTLICRWQTEAGPPTDGWTWAYFPDPEVPFYRVSRVSAYSPANAPSAAVPLPTLFRVTDDGTLGDAENRAGADCPGGPYTSLLFEVCETDSTPWSWKRCRTDSATPSPMGFDGGEWDGATGTWQGNQGIKAGWGGLVWIAM